MNNKTIGQKFAEGFGSENKVLLETILDEDVSFFGTLAWGITGSENIINFASEFHKGLPGLKVVLHDEFYNADKSRGNIRLHLHFSNTGEFMGKKPTNKSGVSVESFAFKIQNEKIIEIIQSGNTFPLAAIELIDFELDFPVDTPDPDEEILSASQKEIKYF